MIQYDDYVDSKFSSDLAKKISTSGYVFTFVGWAICWMQKFQETIYLFTTEVEHMAISHACKEAIWWKSCLDEFGKVHNKVIVFCDGQSVRYLFGYEFCLSQ